MSVACVQTKVKMAKKGRLTAHATCDYMADTVKKEEFGDDEGLDQHDETSCDDR